MWCYISSTVARNSRYGQCLQSLVLAGVQAGVRKVQDQVLLLKQNCCLLLPLNYKGITMKVHVTLRSLHIIYVIFKESYQHSDVLFTMKVEYW